jgi:periplasmic protein TonB
MKFITLYFTLFHLNLFSQQSNLLKQIPIFSISSKVDSIPEYPDGDEGINSFLKNNIEYPKCALENEIEGKVLVKFLVCEDGSICNLNVLSSPDKYLTAETIRCLKKMKNWKPAKKDGIPVKFYYEMPINFFLISPSN